VPEKCTECVGFYDQEACAKVCPVDCCVPDPALPESEAVLLERARALHPDKTIPDDAPSRFKKEGAAAPAAEPKPAAPAPARAAPAGAGAVRGAAADGAGAVLRRAARHRHAREGAWRAHQAEGLFQLLRQRLHEYLIDRPAGATPEELLDLVFTAQGRDPEFG